jgi:alkanesulfonate monooxygenase SsuD/methylene tetrahydromethanopterin reductase-like flavin-dependent oxidoreductase (luciferase family)
MLNNMPILECWTTLSALSQVTKTIRLGTMVTCNSFRNPALLAKMASTVDNVSNGRLDLGIGAGVQKNEHNAYGFPYHSSKVRIERLDEAVEIIRKLWTEEKTIYNGKHYTIKDAVCEPKPVQNPHPPIIWKNIVKPWVEKLVILRSRAGLQDRYSLEKIEKS